MTNSVKQSQFTWWTEAYGSYRQITNGRKMGTKWSNCFLQYSSAALVSLFGISSEFLVMVGTPKWWVKLWIQFNCNFKIIAVRNHDLIIF